MNERKSLLYFSHEPVSISSTTYIKYIREALASAVKEIHHYHAVPNGSKGIEPYLVFGSVVLSGKPPSLPMDSMYIEDQSQVPINTNHSQLSSSLFPSKLQRDVESYTNPTLQSIIQANDKDPKDDLLEHDETVERIISWTSDDVDVTDFKNMPDYDPDQEESVYDSTPDPDVGSTVSSITDFPFQDSSHIRHYTDLNCEKSSSTEALPAKYLLLIFIPGPLAPCSSPSPNHSAPCKHHNFLAHLARYPYLTSHHSYLSHAGYVLESAQLQDPVEYLIVQDFAESDSGRKMSLNWELKRKEAKHWWRKEERGAAGVRAGFFELVKREEISGLFP